MASVLHVFFGDANYHPIVQSYLAMDREHSYVDAPPGGSRFKRIKLLFKKLLDKRKHEGFVQAHEPISFVLSLILFGRNRVILDAHEVFSSFIRAPLLNALAFKVEKLLFSIAKRKVFPSPDRANIFYSDYGKSKGVFIIENLLNDTVLDHKNSISASSKSKSSFDFIYAGTFTERRLVKEIIDAFSILNERGEKEYKLHLYGHSTKYLEESLKGARDYVVYHGAVSRAELISIYPKFTGAFALYRPVDLNNKYCAPTKIFENEFYLLPTICNDSPYLNELVESKRISNVGLIKDFTPNEIALSIEYLSENLNSSCKAIEYLELIELAKAKKLIWSTQLDTIKMLYSEQ